MTDIEIAVKHLDGHSICLCKDGKYFTDDKRGIVPMMHFISEDRDLSGYSVADVVVGKAVAMLFVKSGVKCVHAKVISQVGKDYLDNHSVCCTYDVLTDRIINRMGTDICPMEKAVSEIDDFQTAYDTLKAKLDELRATV